MPAVSPSTSFATRHPIGVQPRRHITATSDATGMTSAATTGTGTEAIATTGVAGTGMIATTADVVMVMAADMDAMATKLGVNH